VGEGGEGRLATVSGAVLTGGASERMGSDKARLELGGIAWATRVAAVLGAICSEVLLVGGNPPKDALGRRVPDPEGPVCALRGLVAALDAARAERVLVVATDLPLVTPELLLALVAWPEADAVVPRSEEGPHPTCALYRREPVLAAARERLGAGRLGLRGVLDAVDTAWIGPEDLARVDPDGLALANLNTPEDLARVEESLRGAGG
jgi:molybdopterin-guanine dinucleotide biosynthesis protein A